MARATKVPSPVMASLCAKFGRPARLVWPTQNQTISPGQRSQPPAHATTKAANADTRHLARRRRDAAHLILIIPIDAPSPRHVATHPGVSPNLVLPCSRIATLTPPTECDYPRPSLAEQYSCHLRHPQWRLRAIRRRVPIILTLALPRGPRALLGGRPPPSAA